MRVIDLHCDTITRCLDENKPLFENDFHLSLQRAGKMERFIECFAVWQRDEYRGEDAVRYFQRYLMRYLREIRQNADIITKIEYAEDLENLDTPFGAILTVEGGSAIGGEITNLNYLFDYGVRIMTLTWNGDNEISGGIRNNQSGLTDFGFSVVEKMNRLGMIVDVSHLSEQGFYDVAKHSKKPFVATHSNLRKICNHKRNLTNEQFDIIKSMGGIVGLNFADIFLAEDAKSADIDCIYRMTDAFMEQGGEKTLAIGSDFDGADMPKGILGVQSLYDIYNYLLQKNYSENLLNDIFYNNAYKFLLNNLPRR